MSAMFSSFLICLIFSFICLQAPWYHEFIIRLWRACGRTFQQFSPTVRLLKAPSEAPSTFKTYHGCFKRWKSWASGFSEITYFPAQEQHVAVYLISLVQSGSSYSSIQQAFYSISFFHNACGVSNPCKLAFLQAILEVCKRVASKPSKLSRVPILPEHLVALVNRFATPSASLGDIRDVCFCLLAFEGFLRSVELSRLRPSSDVVLLPCRTKFRH